ncbi:lysine--tRNA ligase [Mesomycoplasma moatsii]|uniref:lysine--tRNA ligase n=1 Tax=Mesomycoplasma moatsii TaxID=171287 RepID=UPI0003B6977B
MREFSEQELIRRNKVKENNNLGIQSYLKKQKISHKIENILEEFKNYSKEELESKNEIVSTYGRILSKRGPFTQIRLDEFSCQIYINNKMNEKLFDFVSKLDIGDIVWVEGIVMKTMTNEIAIKAQQVKLMSKSLKVLPEKYHGLTDVEDRYRHRYVDLIVNKNVRETFRTRTKIIMGIRKFFDSRGYLEVDTPILQPILGGAAAKPFTTHHNALNREFYLRIATELPLKKLIVGGFEKVYEIGRIFRNEGIDTTHNPEFTSIEFYEANADLEDMMNYTEDVIKFLAKELGKEEIEWNGATINLVDKFKRIDMSDEVSKYVGFDVKKASFDDLKKEVEKIHEKIESYYDEGHLINLLFEYYVEKTLIQPTFVYGHPLSISPLAAKNEKDPRFTDRAELFINKKEFANMFTELSDPIDQLDRFENQLKEREAGNDEANEIDWDFIEALEYGMPPAGGCGIGIDRLVMLLTNNVSIREIILFPHLKAE